MENTVNHKDLVNAWDELLEEDRSRQKLWMDAVLNELDAVIDSAQKWEYTPTELTRVLHQRIDSLKRTAPKLKWF
ncbi:hypothetical protein [Dinghuibacter silviterrae]|uniref:Uncharacterized protein n=1 Tax=Dinghuibacter silviterrae TaxID=1539049 RepID=A0A4R8DWF7_9BACT|nr:hypothetical protein [Dinghuibacter silviterrae]TDX01835.1 hypothetical protein EDB95_2878 [Dinghuibacter silviterrae]